MLALDAQEHQESQELRSVLPKDFQVNEYRVEAVLGKPGGFGITYLARDINLDRFVAVKEYLPTEFAMRDTKSSVCVRSASDQENFSWGLERFADEAKVLARFNHPNIVRILRFFRENNTAYMVMEYQEGRSLTEYLREGNGTLSEEALLSMAIPLAEGLKVIHEAGFLHRDIKPNNIYIRHQGDSPLLLDFGSARHAVGQRSLSVTSIVSPGYAPLEQYGNEINEQGPWTDIYALGAVMYCAIKGEAPPAATSRVMRDPMIPATQVGEGKYNRNLLTAIDWALELNPENRPQTMDEWQKRLVSPSSQNYLFSENRSPLQRFSELRRSIVTAAGVVVVLLLMAATGVLLHQSNEITKERTVRLEAEKRLVAEQELRKAEENARSQAEATLEQIKRFEDQTTIIARSRLEEFGSKKPDFVRYYDVVNVSDDDTLNIRVFPGSANEIIGEIPYNGKCIAYLNRIHLYKSLKTSKASLWVMIRYQEIEGWVHSSFLTENTHCNKNNQHENNR